MPTRKQEVRSEADAVAQLAERIRRLEDTSARRVLPPGYEFSIGSGGDLVVIRVSDGASMVVGSF